MSQWSTILEKVRDAYITEGEDVFDPENSE
jgi:hypothetical protein